MKKFEKGFTLIEMLGVIAIISVLLSISSVGIRCILINTEHQESLADAKTILLSVDNYYNHRDELPVKESASVDLLDADTKKIAAKKIGKFKSDDGTVTMTGEEVIEALLASGSIYEIDYSKLSFSGGMDESTVDKYLVIYVTENSGVPKEFMEYNTTLIKKYLVKTCAGNEFAIQLGKKKYENISDGLNFKIDEKYIECPNPELCNRLEENNK